MYDIIVLWTTKYSTNIEEVPRNNPEKNTYTKIEDSYPYIAELVQNMPKYLISGKITGQFMLGDWNPFM